jgi:uncharacterized membrane protein
MIKFLLKLPDLMQSFFRDKRQYNLFKILCLSTLFDVVLVFYRINHTEFDLGELNNLDAVKATRGTYGTFFFLIWNLFLAWLPYWIALILDFFTRLKKTPSLFSLISLVFLWLLFFPNAPYIVTDLLHLRDRHVVPHWYDLMLIVSFAWTGLILGYCSLFEVQRFLEQRFKSWFVWIVTIGAIWLGGFGVYMGRFQRWNSWDAFTHPFAVARQQAHILKNPLEYLDTLGMAVVLSGFLMIGYMTLNAMRRA